MTYIYRSPTTPAGPGWVVDLGNQAVRLGTVSVIMEAELGSVAISSLAFDDPTGTAGHDSDAIVGLKQFTINELAAPLNNRRIFEGYVADRRYYRGTESSSPSLRTGAARTIDMTLVDLNSFLSFRVFLPTGVGHDDWVFNRPAETDADRVAALLANDLLSSTLFDNGNVSTTSPVNMDAVDYTGQRPADVLNDCAQQSGKNFFVYYDEVANQFSLFYDFNASTSYPAYDTDLKISNVLADVDLTSLATTGPIWPPLEDAVLTRDPSRVVAGVLFQNGSDSVYEQQLSTSYTYGYRDAVGNSQNLKTTAQAEARAQRYLAENSTEDDRITFTVKFPAANVNDWKEGQWAPVKFSHLPGYEDYVNVRCLTRTVSQDEYSDQFYNVKYECTPMGPGSPSGATDSWNPGDGSVSSGSGESGAIAILPRQSTPGNLLVALIGVFGSEGFSSVNSPTYETVDDGSDFAWTEIENITAYDSTANVNHSWPVSDSSNVMVPIRFVIAYRKVQPGEVTTRPLRTLQAGPGATAKICVWLWEFPTTSTPSSSTSVQMDPSGIGSWVNPGPGGGSASITVGSNLSGWVLGGFIVSTVDYGPTPIIVPTNGTTIRASGAEAGHAGRDGVTRQNQNDINALSFGSSYRWAIPWLWIGQSPTGTALAVNMQYHDVPEGSPGSYNNFSNRNFIAGASVVIPGNTTTIPDIPYPGNQTT